MKIPQRTLITIAVIVALTLSGMALYLAWEIEESSNPVRTVIVEDLEEKGVFTVEIREQEGQDFIVYCDEERFQEAFSMFADHVGVETEPLRVPGGPMVLAFADVTVPENFQPAYRTLVQMLKRHAPSRVVLVSHSECLLYDSIAAWQNNLAAVRDRQQQDLIAAQKALRAWLPRTEVEVYYADKRGTQLKFLRISPRGS